MIKHKLVWSAIVVGILLVGFFWRNAIISQEEYAKGEQRICTEADWIKVSETAQFLQEMSEGWQEYNRYITEGEQRHARTDLMGAIQVFTQGRELAKQRNHETIENLFYSLTGTTLRELGQALEKEGRLTAALDRFKEALQVFKDLKRADLEARILNQIGNIFLEFANYSNAYSAFAQARQLWKECKNPLKEGHDLLNMALALGRIGDLSGSLNAHEESLQIFKSLDKWEEQGHVLNNRADALMQVGDNHGAEKDLLAAIEIFDKLQIPVKKAAVLVTLGALYDKEGEYNKEEEYNKTMEILKAARAIFKEYGDRRIIEVELRMLYLHLYWLCSQPQRWHEALNILERRDAPFARGICYLQNGEYRQAQQEFLKSQQNEVIKSNAEGRMTVQIGLGLALEGLQDDAGARDAYLEAVTFIEGQYQQLTEANRKLFFAAKVGDFPRLAPYEGLVRIALRQGRAEESFLLAEQTKARRFLDAIAKRYGAGTQQIPPDLADEETRLTAAIASCLKQQDFALQHNNQKEYQTQEAELRRLKKEQQSLINSLWQCCREYASLRYPQPLGPERIDLHDDELLLVYEVTATETLAWLLEKGPILQVFRIPLSREELGEKVQTYTGAFQNIAEQQTLSAFKTYDPELGAELYNYLIPPDLRPLLRKDKKLIIVPDEILGVLPFETLVTARPKNLEWGTSAIGVSPKHVKYLGDEYDVSYYQSATSLTTIRSLKKGGATASLFAVADPIFNSTDERVTQIAQADQVKEERFSTQREDVRKTISDGAGVSFSRVPKTGILAKKLDDTFDHTGKVLTGADATEANVKAENLEKYRYLVFATHGILDETIPYLQEPALVLAHPKFVGPPKLKTSLLSWLTTTPQNTDREEQTPGFYTLSEVMDTKINAEVAALIACNTGQGKHLTGEGVMGMGRAFQYAGAKTVLMSLWTVAEESTTLLAERFFIYLKDGKGKLEALRLARGDVRAAGYEHPYFWAPFILVGEQ